MGSKGLLFYYKAGDPSKAKNLKILLSSLIFFRLRRLGFSMETGSPAVPISVPVDAIAVSDVSACDFIRSKIHETYYIVGSWRLDFDVLYFGVNEFL
jgi:hypothetical protein